MFQIIPEKVYSASNQETVDRAKREILAGVHPPLNATFADLPDSDAIFIGSPNWWSTIALTVATFLAGFDLAGRTSAPFCTHIGAWLAEISLLGSEIKTNT